MIGFEAGLGMLISLVAFKRAESGTRKLSGEIQHASKEIQNAIKDEQTTLDYLEWLRRQDLDDLIGRLDATKSSLIGEMATLGGNLDTLASGVLQAAGDLSVKIQALNDRIPPPVLSAIPLPNRPRTSIGLLGREQEQRWLEDTEGDTLLCGQPGSGKTVLLEFLARCGNAWFLLSDDLDTIVKAVLSQRPPILIVDDAGTKHDVILRLRQLRIEHGLPLRIVAACWPFEQDDLQRTLAVNDKATLKLEGLPLPIIAQIIREIIRSKGLVANDDFIRIVSRQARGKPGLAASLSLAAIEASSDALVSGDLLLKDLYPFLKRIAGEEATHILAAFSCGGSRGISQTAVAEHLRFRISEIAAMTRHIALAGVLEQTQRNSLCVQPDFLRAALIKEAFFHPTSVCLPSNLCNELINSAEDPVEGYLEIIRARHLSGVCISDSLLREFTQRLDDKRLWEALAWLDGANCAWVIGNTREYNPSIKRAALHYCPELIIPSMLTSASADKRSLNSAPDADMRILQEWSTQGWADEGVKRRRSLLSSAIKWRKTGGTACTAIKAMGAVLNLSFEDSDSDPADPRTFRRRRGILPLDNAKQVFDMWGEILSALKDMEAIPWAELVSLLNNWIHPQISTSQSLSDEYQDFLYPSAQQMLADLLLLAKDNQAALRWLYLRGLDIDMPFEAIPVSPDYMTLFPKEEYGEDWEAKNAKQIQESRLLAAKWQTRPFSELVELLCTWERQAEELGRVWPQFVTDFWIALSALRQLTPDEQKIAIQNLPPGNLAPFLESAIEAGRMSDEDFKECFSRPELQNLLIQLTLSGKTPYLYPRLEPSFSGWNSTIEIMCLRELIPEDMLRSLLCHSNPSVRLEVAFGIIQSKPTPGVPGPLRELWREAVVAGLAQLFEQDFGDRPHAINAVLDFDPSIGKSVLEKIISSGREVYGNRSNDILPALVNTLNKETKRVFLHRCKHFIYSPLPVLLVGCDEDLFREMLDIPELKKFCLDVLAGSSTKENWAILVKIALANGHSFQRILSVTNFEGGSWEWGPRSIHYQKWIDRFEKLQQHDDVDIRQIGNDGLIWAIGERDREVDRERNEKIYGWSE